jgi:hypothetical protein
VEEIIDLDFRIMIQLAHCLDVFPSLCSMRLGESMSQFSSSIAAQTSLFQEGKHLQKVSSQFRLLIEYIRNPSHPIPFHLIPSHPISSALQFNRHFDHRQWADVGFPERSLSHSFLERA